MTPDTTFKFKGKKCVKRQKTKKKKFNNVVMCKYEWNGQKELFIIGQSQKPRCFKNVKKLPVEYVAIKRHG
jgi:hypothetical protein